MDTVKSVKTLIIVRSESECSDNCPFNHLGKHCELFEKPIGNSEEHNVRCDKCINSEIK